MHTWAPEGGGVSGDQVMARTPAPCAAAGEAPGFWSGSAAAECGSEKWQSSLRCRTARRGDLKQLRPSRHAAPPGGFTAQYPGGAPGPRRPPLPWWGMSCGRPGDDLERIKHPYLLPFISLLRFLPFTP